MFVLFAPSTSCIGLCVAQYDSILVKLMLKVETTKKLSELEGGKSN